MAEPIAVEEKKNDKVQVLVRKFPHCKVEWEVTTGTPLIQKSKEDATKAIRKEVSLPGFRKGKVPENMVTKNFSASIQDKAKKLLADSVFLAAMELVKIPLLNNNAPIHFHPLRLSDTEATLSFSYETEPSVPAVKIEDFLLQKVEKPEAGEKELQEAIRQMQFFYAKWTPVMDRKVQEGDHILIDLQTLEDPPKEVFNDTRFEVSDGHMAQWMKKLVLGKDVGAKVEGISEPDAELPEAKKKEFSPKRILLTIKKIETAELPEVNEEFAQKVGAKSLEEMKNYLQEMIRRKADEKVDHETREQVNAFLLNIPFDLPLSLVQKEKQHRRKQYEQDPRYQAKLRQMNDLQRDMERLELEEAIQNQSESAVRLFYVSRQIVRDAKIDVSYREVQEEAMRTLKVFGPVRVDPKSVPEEVFALALSKIILAKAQDHILNQAKQIA